MPRTSVRGPWVVVLLAVLGVVPTAAAQPSLLDKLDRKDIPKEERTDWLPDEAVAVLGSQRGRHWSYLFDVTASRNGKVLVSRGGEGVRLWDATTLRELGAVHERDYVAGAALSPDGQTLAISTLSGTNEPALQLWRVTAAGLQRGPLIPEVRGAGILAFSADGKVLLVSHATGAEFWDVTQAPPLRLAAHPLRDLMPEKGVRTWYAFTPTGGKTAWWSLEPRGDDPAKGTRLHLKLWDIGKVKGEEVALSLCPGKVRDVALSADARDAAVLSAEGADKARETFILAVWDLTARPPKLRAQHTLDGAAGDARLTLAPDGKRVALHRKGFGKGAERPLTWMVTRFGRWTAPS